jgi:hypothetical protein
VAVTDADREEVRRQLRDDYVFYPERALRIVASDEREIAFALKRPQERLARALMAQRDPASRSARSILKARKVGFSTQAQGILIQRATQIPNHLAMVVAHDGDTAAEVFGIGRFMWARLPAQIQPELAYERNGRRHKFLHVRRAVADAAPRGRDGPQLDGAHPDGRHGAGRGAGRGLTIRSLHMSEGAFWEAQGKRLALLNAVPDDPDTLISTSRPRTATTLSRTRGTRRWRARRLPRVLHAVVRGARLPPAVRQRARARRLRGDALCTGPWGEDEEELLELIPARIREWEVEFGDAPLSDADLQTRVLEHLQLAPLGDRGEVRVGRREVPPGVPVHARGGVPVDGPQGLQRGDRRQAHEGRR